MRELLLWFVQVVSVLLVHVHLHDEGAAHACEWEVACCVPWFVEAFSQLVVQPPCRRTKGHINS